MGARGILRTVEDGGLMFWCPGCDGAHIVQTGEGPGPRWSFNGNYDRPSFTPSVRVRGTERIDGQDEESLATIDELVAERQERDVIRKWMRRLWHGAIATLVATALGAHWFSDQLAWVAERLPVLRQFWQLVTGSFQK